VDVVVVVVVVVVEEDMEGNRAYPWCINEYVTKQESSDVRNEEKYS
jgi:hypothetical protein